MLVSSDDRSHSALAHSAHAVHADKHTHTHIHYAYYVHVCLYIRLVLGIGLCYEFLRCMIIHID